MKHCLDSRSNKHFYHLIYAPFHPYQLSAFSTISGTSEITSFPISINIDTPVNIAVMVIALCDDTSRGKRSGDLCF